MAGGPHHSLPLVNLSKYSANSTLYYETETWGARISEAYRGKYPDSAGGNGNIGEGYEATNNLDFSAHYSRYDEVRAVHSCRAMKWRAAGAHACHDLHIRCALRRPW